jgi:hypothetical protein
VVADFPEAECQFTKLNDECLEYVHLKSMVDFKEKLIGGRRGA